MIAKKKNYLITFFFLKKKMKIKIRNKNKYLLIFSYFNIFIIFYKLIKNYWKINKKIKTTTIFFSRSLKNKFLNIQYKLFKYFLSVGLYKTFTKQKGLKINVSFKTLLMFIFKKFIYNLNRFISLKIFKIFDDIFTINNQILNLLYFYNKKIFKLSFFKVTNIFLILKKNYGYLKVKKFPRKKRFLMKRINMFFKYFKPITNGTRNKKINILRNRYKFKPLLFKLKKKKFINVKGQIILRGRLSYKKALYRLWDKYNYKYNKAYNFLGYEKTKYSKGYLGLVKSSDNFYKYMLAPNSIEPGNKILTTFSFLNKIDSLGWNLPVGWIPNNTLIYNLEIRPCQGSKLIRSAGCFGKIVGHNLDSVDIKLPSKSVITVSKFCMASIGRVSNIFNKFENKGTAGYNRRLGYRSNVLGESMNACDHPNGGRTRKGKPSKNYWGKIIK